MFHLFIGYTYSYCHSMMSLMMCTFLFLGTPPVVQYISQAFWVPKAPDLTSCIIWYTVNRPPSRSIPSPPSLIPLRAFFTKTLCLRRGYFYSEPEPRTSALVPQSQ